MGYAASARIAIFDADAGMLELYRELLEDEGASIILHADSTRLTAAEARRLLLEGDPQAVIWDVAPPYTTSADVLRELSGGGDLDGRAVIVTTTDKLQVDGLLGDGIAAVVAKPFNIEEVAALLKRGVRRDGGSP